MLIAPDMIGWIGAAVVFVEFRHGKFLRRGGFCYLRVNDESFCSLSDRFAKFPWSVCNSFPSDSGIYQPHEVMFSPRLRASIFLC